MQPNIFDIHSHLNFPDFNQDREEIIKKMKEEEIFSIVVGTDKETSQSAIGLTERNENLFASVGLHPTDHLGVQHPSGDWISKLKELAQHPKVVAIGECGLDYYRNPENQISNLKSQNDKSKFKNFKDRQKYLFEQQIKLAIELNKPLMIHCRDAHDEVLEILNSYFLLHNSKLRGNIHFFSGDWELAQKYFDLGFTISFTGVITFTSQYDEVVKKAPLGKIMIETDAPFVAPVPFRGKRNEPAYVKEVARRIAEIRGISYEEVLHATTENALRMFVK